VEVGGKELVEAVGEVAGQGLATGEDAGQGGAEGSLPEEGAKHGGHEVAGGDPVTGDGLLEQARVAVGVGGSQDQAGSHEQGPEELTGREVEADGGLLEHALAGPEREQLLHPGQAVEEGAVADHDPLGGAGRARGVDGVGEVVWTCPAFVD
jgi:hypothetical protein